MEFTNDTVSVFLRYLSAKRNFSNILYLLGKGADISAMGKKEKLQYYLIMHREVLLYGIFIFFNRIWKRFRGTKK